MINKIGTQHFEAHLHKKFTMSSSYDNNCFILIKDASGNSIFIDSKKIFNELEVLIQETKNRWENKLI